MPVIEFVFEVIFVVFVAIFAVFVAIFAVLVAIFAVLVATLVFNVFIEPVLLAILVLAVDKLEFRLLICCV